MIVEENLDNYKIKINFDNVGYIIVEETPEIINVIDVFVNEDRRREGIAKSLFNYIFEKYENKNVKLMLEVREDNMPAINLYKNFGFEVIYKREKYYKDSDALIMEVKL